MMNAIQAAWDAHVLTPLDEILILKKCIASNIEFIKKLPIWTVQHQVCKLMLSIIAGEFIEPKSQQHDSDL